MRTTCSGATTASRSPWSRPSARGEAPPTTAGALGESLGKRLFEARLSLIGELDHHRRAAGREAARIARSSHSARGARHRAPESEEAPRSYPEQPRRRGRPGQSGRGSHPPQSGGRAHPRHRRGRRSASRLDRRLWALPTGWDHALSAGRAAAGPRAPRRNRQRRRDVLSAHAAIGGMLHRGERVNQRARSMKRQEGAATE